MINAAHSAPALPITTVAEWEAELRAKLYAADLAIRLRDALSPNELRAYIFLADERSRAAVETIAGQTIRAGSRSSYSAAYEIYSPVASFACLPLASPGVVVMVPPRPPTEAEELAAMEAEET